MQYQGSASIGGTQIYVTGATATISRNAIAPDIVWGKAWKVNYANGHKEASVSFTFPWFAAYTSIINSCIGIGPSLRDAFKSVVVNNGGTIVTLAQAKCASLSFDINALGGDAIMCTAEFKGLDAVVTASSVTGTGIANDLGNTPVPAYMATAVLTGSPAVASNKITSVRLNISNNIFSLFVLNGSETATDLQLGLITVDGSVTYYSAGVSGGATTGGLSG